MISRGHKYDDLLYKYSWAQFWAFYEKSIENKNDALKETAITVRNAMHAPDNDFKKFINQLDNGAKKRMKKINIEALNYILGGH